MAADTARAPEVRPAHRRPWWTLRRVRRARRSVQLAALAGVLALFAGARNGWPNDLVNLPLRLDPLAMLAHLLASRTFLTGSTLALLTVGLTLALGRGWCGWLCPLGTVLDLFPLRQWRGKRPPPPEGWRAAKYGLLLTLVSAALLANLTLLSLDPLTLFFRTLAVSAWPALDRLVTLAEAALYPLPALQEPLSILDAWLRPAILPAEPTYYRDALLYAGVFLGVIALNALAERFWCRYLCPLGGLLGLLSKVAVVRRQVVRPACTDCDACTRVCPTGAIRPEQGYASDPGECTLCLDCLVACPRGGNQLAAHASAAPWHSYDPGRRETLIALGTAVAGVCLLNSDLLAAREHPHQIRPPGARENNLLAKCVRCGECVRVCPTGGLQPALEEAGVEGLWTPVLVPRAGYCHYACHACGQVCPVQAIPPLSLEAKQSAVIGAAYIDQNRCIAWSDHRPCIICEEMCPLPEKAIVLETLAVRDEQGQPVSLQVPRMLRERCIGCGICEYRCPVPGTAAIRVYVPGGGTL